MAPWVPRSEGREGVPHRQWQREAPTGRSSVFLCLLPLALTRNRAGHPGEVIKLIGGPLCMNVLHEWQKLFRMHSLIWSSQQPSEGCGSATVLGIVLHLRNPGLSLGALCFISHDDTEEHGPQNYQLKGHKHHGLHEHCGGLLGKTSN